MIIGTTNSLIVTLPKIASIATVTKVVNVVYNERVIVDSRQGDYYVCRTQYDSPEVDEELLIPVAGHRLFRGRFYDARITAAEEYDLYGEWVGNGRLRS